MTILDKLAEHAFERVKAAKKSVSLDEIKSYAKCRTCIQQNSVSSVSLFTA